MKDQLSLRLPFLLFFPLLSRELRTLIHSHVLLPHITLVPALTLPLLLHLMGPLDSGTVATVVEMIQTH